jgi:hypothetical protein
VLEPAISDAVSIGLSHPAPLASAATMASMLVAYILCTISARKTGVNFCLRRLETVELNRAVLLYKKVVDRLQDIDREGKHARGNLFARYNHRRQVRRKFSTELADLQAYAAHLRSTIMRLRRRPMQRYKSWLHIHSSRFALSRSVTACFLALAMLAAGSWLFEQYAHALLGEHALSEEMDVMLASFLAWQPVHDRMAYAHSIGAGFLPVMTSYLYVYRRAKLLSEHRQKFRMLKEFAVTDPDRLIHQAPVDTDVSDEPVEAPARTAAERTWFCVLGLSPSATIDEIKQAYKLQIKQNHPDRVHDMSPMFRELAEAETKKLNAAYEEALLSLQHV